MTNAEITKQDSLSFINGCYCVVTSGRSKISPRRGRQLPGEEGGRQHTILPNFLKNYMKLKEFGPGGGGGSASLVPR